jgi:RimJ/RimL family protein N-acetyltransferase
VKWGIIADLVQSTDMKESVQRRAASQPAWWRRLVWPAWQLALEPVDRAHAGRVRRALTSEIAQWLGTGSLDDMRAGTLVWASEAESLALKGAAFRYLAVRDGRFAGVIEVRPDAVRGHVGYWLRRAERGRGTITLANRLVLAIAFDGIGLRAVDWTADARNADSIAVMERLGARHIATNKAWTAGRELEVRYRVERASYHADPTGPASLRALIRESDNVTMDPLTGT